MSSPQWQNTVVPAQLSFLAIYNPTLGPTDETFKDQAVFYYSRVQHEARSATRKNARGDPGGAAALREEENEKLRQIGLAQGMVDFARSFSDGQPVDSIDTEKSRIVLHELEKDWWILASIDLTRLPGLLQSSNTASKKGSGESGAAVEYSAREVTPASLLIQQLIQAHHIFSLHHGTSLSAIYVRVARDRFCSVLDRFWTRFARTWDVLLHGNPAADIFGGMKLASGGELGMGVGEEEWGSGERDVLEDLARRTEGLVDLVVARFGDVPPPKGETSMAEREALPWLGGGNYPLASDGIIFGGINGITKPSLKNVSLWMRQIYTYGEYAYGVRDNPMRERRKRRRREPPLPEPDTEPARTSDGNANTPATTETTDFAAKPQVSDTEASPETVGRPDEAVGSDDVAEPISRPGIPPPIVSAAEVSLSRATNKAGAANKTAAAVTDDGTTMGIPDQYMKYLTFGLSTLAKSQKRPEPPRRTSTSSSRTIIAHQYAPSKLSKHEELDENEEDDPTPLSQMEPKPDGDDLRSRIAMQKYLEQKGHFVIGLKGDLDDLPEFEHISMNDLDDDPNGLRNVLRAIHVQVAPEQDEDDEESLAGKLAAAGLQPECSGRTKRLRVLVYAHRPFLYCFLFEGQAPSLAIARFYKDLHRNLVPIHKPLLSSTSFSKIAQRIEEAQVPSDNVSGMSGSSSKKTPEQPSPIYDLIYDPALLTVHTSIPNIPEPGTPAAEGIFPSRKDGGRPDVPAWTRLEALNVHSQVLNTLISVKRSPREYERTSKTSRGWWVVWMKLAPSTHEETEVDPLVELQNKPNKPPGVDNQSTTAIAFPATLPKEDSAGTEQAISARQPSTPTPMLPMNRIAFLVRKATDATAPAKPSTASEATSSMWSALTLRPTSTSDENTGGAGAGWGPSALAGGIGFDPRKYVEGLLSLNR